KFIGAKLTGRLPRPLCPNPCTRLPISPDSRLPSPHRTEGVKNCFPVPSRTPPLEERTGEKRPLFGYRLLAIPRRRRRAIGLSAPLAKLAIAPCSSPTPRHMGWGAGRKTVANEWGQANMGYVFLSDSLAPIRLPLFLLRKAREFLHSANPMRWGEGGV